MSPLKLSSAEITTMVYPTELEDRVRSILIFLSGENGDIAEERFSSHYGYSFKVLTVRVDWEAAENLFRVLICSLPDYDLELLLRTLQSRMDGRHLYLRLDKQELVDGRHTLYSGGPGGYVRIKFTFSKKISDLESMIRETRKTCRSTST